jgi:hypothetical protein
VLGAVWPSRRTWRRLLWLVPLLFAGFAFLTAVIELAYLEVIAVLWAGCLASTLRSPPPARL